MTIKRTYFYFLVSVVILLGGLCLPKSLLTPVSYCDESWLMLLIQAKQPCLGSNFALYYSFLADWHMTYIHALIFIMGLITRGGCALALLYYFRKSIHFSFVEKILLALWACFVPTIAWGFNSLSMPDYRQLAAFFAFNGFSLLLLGLDDEQKTLWRNFFLIVSGVFFVQVTFTVAPIAIIAPFLLIMIWYQNRKYTIPFIAGGIIGIAIYFLFVQSPKEYIGELMYSVHTSINATGEKHGTGMLITCYFKIIIEYLTVLIPGGLALYGCEHIADAKRKKIVFGGVIGIVIFNFLLQSYRLIRWNCAGVPAFSVLFIVILFIYLAMVHWEKTERKYDNWVILCALVLPTVFCTATDQGFGNRLTAFISIVYVINVILTFLHQSRVGYLLMNLFLVLGICAGVIYLKRNGGIKPEVSVLTQTVGLPSHARLTESKAKLIQRILQESNDCPVWATDEFSWDLVLLAKKKPLILRHFRYYKFDDMADLCKEQGLKTKDIIFLEKKERALSQDKLTKIAEALGGENWEHIAVSSSLTLVRFK